MGRRGRRAAGEEEAEQEDRVGDIDRRTCRREALRRFSPRAMADGYEAIYRIVTEIDERPIQEILSAAFPALEAVDGAGPASRRDIGASKIVYGERHADPAS